MVNAFASKGIFVNSLIKFIVFGDGSSQSSPLKKISSPKFKNNL